MIPGSGFSVPSASAGTMSVPRSMASTCMTVRGSGMFSMICSMKGQASGTLLVRM